jgi:hypothetical protein
LYTIHKSDFTQKFSTLHFSFLAIPTKSADRDLLLPSVHIPTWNTS